MQRSAYASCTRGSPERFANLTVGEEHAEERGGALLSDLTARLLDARIEGVGSAHEPFKGHRTRGMRDAPEALDVHQRDGGDRRVRLRPVDERDAFFRLQRHRRERRVLEHRCGGTGVVAAAQHALADEREREMREWREITACADASLLRDLGV